MATKKPPAKKAAVIYGLLDPRTGELRYIGKANDPNQRLKSHIRDSRRRHTPLYSWMRKLTECGLTPNITVLEVPEDWREAEIRLISLHQPGGRLLNLAAGGDQPFCPREVCAANGRATAKAVHSDPYRRRVWELKRWIAQHLHCCIKSGDKSAEARARARMRRLAESRPDICAEWSVL